MSALEEQNKDIAEGILALADIIKKHNQKPRPLRPMSAEPAISGGPLDNEPEPMFRDLPPPRSPMPFPEEKKKSLFGFK